MEGSATVHMAAPAAKIWDLIADVRNTGKFSPEVFEAEWLGDSTGPSLGAKFRGHVKRNEMGPVYWTTCKVTECVPGQVFEFAVIMGERPVNTWRYEFRASVDGGTEVTESFDLGDNLFTKVWRPLVGYLRERRNRRDMLTTLERIRLVAERG